jgi:uncharacterized protein (DUF427 family)
MPAQIADGRRAAQLIAAGYKVWDEPCARRLRVVFANQVVADSIRAVYLFETGHLPVYYFPIADVRFELLEESEHHTHCSFKGEASYWSLTADGRRAENAVWGYARPVASCPDISGHVAFYWDQVDAWFEEDEEVFVHPRDPYRRVDVLHSSRHIQVVLGGQVVADSVRARLLFETGLRTHYYLPRLDVRVDLLTASATVTRCPYKGVASLYSAEVEGTKFRDVAWSYPAPRPEAAKVENLICFDDERVDRLLVDGIEEPKPTTGW